MWNKNMRPWKHSDLRNRGNVMLRSWKSYFKMTPNRFHLWCASENHIKATAPTENTNFCLITRSISLRSFPCTFNFWCFSERLWSWIRLSSGAIETRETTCRALFWLRCDFHKQARWLTLAARQGNISPSAHLCYDCRREQNRSRKE